MDASDPYDQDSQLQSGNNSMEGLTTEIEGVLRSASSTTVTEIEEYLSGVHDQETAANTLR